METLGMLEAFDLPNGRKVRIKKPSIGVLEQVNLEASKYASTLIRDGGLLTKQELQNILENKNTTQTASRLKMQENIKKMQVLEEKYNSVEDPKQKDKIVDELQVLQQQVMEGMDNIYEIYGISIESMVEKYKKLIMMQKCAVLQEDGSLYWPTLQDLLNEEDMDSYNVISIRFSEVLGIVNLTDEQRSALNQLLSASEGTDNIEPDSN
jgi:hypothetical protein